MAARQRPPWLDYFMGIAWDVSGRANCSRRPVGALIVKDQRIISTGYNGTPFGVKNCDEGGCSRCESDAPRHHGYETCLCVHAEQNAIVLAARQGTATENATLYVTLRPCLGCLKEIIQAGIREVVYDQPFDYEGKLKNVEKAYQNLIKDANILMRQHPYSATHSLPQSVASESYSTEPEMPEM